MSIVADLTNAGISYTRGNYADASLSMAAAVPLAGTVAGLAKIAKTAKKVVRKAAYKIRPPKRRGLGGNPFKDKTAKQIDRMLKKKGLEPKGEDPMRGKGSYYKENVERSYHIDPEGVGRYREPSHVDVSRPRGYRGPLGKKRFPYKGD